MKTLIIGDIHGHDTWMEIMKIENPDRVIFLGDYLDSFTVEPQIQVDNFYKIIELKQEMGDNCILCIGNHDLSYCIPTGCSGYKVKTQNLLGDDVRRFYEDGTLVPFHVEDNIIFSHAGITKTWLKKVCGVDKLELLGDVRLEWLDFNTISGFDAYGDNKSQGPVWVRPTSLLADAVNGYEQFVGHTHMKEARGLEFVYFCDTLPDSYWIIENGKKIIKKLSKEDD